jgi:hypothetical protein
MDHLPLVQGRMTFAESLNAAVLMAFIIVNWNEMSKKDSK